MTASDSLRDLIASYVRSELPPERLLSDEAWLGAPAIDLEEVLLSHTFNLVEASRLLLLWEVDLRLPTLGRIAAQRVMTDPNAPEETRRAANRHWLDAPLNDLSIRGMFDAWADSEMVWARAVIAWGMDQLPAEVLHSMSHGKAPTSMRASTTAP